MKKSMKRGPITRRGALRTLAAGAAAGLGGTLGAPMIWAQAIRDVTLMHVGPAYSIFPDIAAKASADLSFKVEMQNAWTDAIMARVLGQPDTIDIADLEFWALQRIWRAQKLQPIETAKIANWEKITPLFREGVNFDGSPMSRQGTLPFKVQYVAAEGDKTFAAGPSGLETMMPTIFNADTLGLRPDLVGRPLESWAELLSPDFRGKTVLINVPQIGIMDAAMALEAKGEVTYADKGNMTRAEIDQTISALIALKKQGHFRAFWSSFDESVNYMASGEVVIQSMWSPAVTAVRARGVDCEYKG